jgi:PAS domain S-box-containing protein
MIENPWHILIIDDNPEDRREMRRMLLLGSDRHYYFTEVSLGGDGISSILNMRPNRYDCVLLDFSLPDMDAVEWLRHLESDSSLDVTPVVVITGGAKTDGRNLLRVGAQDFVGKSWSSPESLTRAVENAVDRFALMNERKLARRQLSASESKLNLGVTLAGLGLGEVDFHSDTISLDEIAAKIFDLPANTAVARRDLHAIFHPDERSVILQKISESLDSHSEGYLSLEHRIIKRDGSIAWVSVRTKIEFANHPSGQQRAIRGSLAVLDVTQRKSALGLLEKSEKRYRSLFASIDEGFCIVKLVFDKEGKVADYRFLEVNPAFARQTGLENAQGKTIRQLLPDIDEHWFDVYGAVSLTGEAIKLERFSEALGRWYEVYAFRIDEAEKDQIAILFKDISPRKHAESKLNETIALAESASQAKSEFLTNMSHELRTPLNSILGFAQLMQAGVPSPSPKQTQSLDHIIKAGWYLLRLINETLDLSVIESGVAPTFLEVVNIAEVVQECEELMRPLAQERQIVIDHQSVNPHLSAYADQTRVKQIIINLFSNAIKYGEKGSVVRVTCGQQRVGFVHLAVIDAGPGLSESEMKLLFMPFQRLNKTAATVSGTGIGLAMCKRLTELMHGTIGVESNVGQGCAFWIELPEPEGETPKPEAIENPLKLIEKSHLASEQGCTYSLLHIDDNPLNLELVQELIGQRPNHRLLSASHHGLGHELAQAHQPQVILMDINLPGRTGVESLKKLRENPLTSHIPVIALSSNAKAQEIEQGISAGFLRFVAKPINAEDFLSAVDEALGLSDQPRA